MPQCGEPGDAMTLCGNTSPSACNTMLPRKCPVSIRDLPDAGNTGLTMHPSGARMVIGRNDPSWLGKFGASMHFTPYTVCANVKHMAELIARSTCGDVPAKSISIVSPATVNAI